MKEKLPKPHIHHFEPTFFAQVLSAPPPSAARHPLEDDSGFLGEKVVFDAFLGIPSCPTHPTNMNIEQKTQKKIQNNRVKAHLVAMCLGLPKQ